MSYKFFFHVTFKVSRYLRILAHISFCSIRFVNLITLVYEGRMDVHALLDLIS